MSVHRLNHRDHIGIADNTLFYYEVTGEDRRTQVTDYTESYSDWRDFTLDVGNFKVIPYGRDNDIPEQIQQAVFPNSLGPRLQNRKVELLNGQGPYLYKEVSNGKQFEREPVQDEKIMAWLNGFQYQDHLYRNGVDYYYQNMVVTKVYLDRASRIEGISSVAKVEHIHAYKCRKAYRKNASTETPTHVIIGDWENTNSNEFDVYPIFDPNDPKRHRVSIHISSVYSYGVEDYAVPEILGALEWIRRSTSIPKILQAYTDNSLNIKWHIQSPAKYWDAKRHILKENCKAENKVYKEKMLEDLKLQILTKLQELLSGVDNVGKFWHNEQVIEIVGGTVIEHGWKIIPIDQKVKDYIDAQLKIAEKSDFATVAAFGLHTALGNVGADGKSDSGSELLNAYQIHQLTSTNLPEYHVTKALNDCIKLKFNTDIKVGFYQVAAVRQQDVSEGLRSNRQTINPRS